MVALLNLLSLNKQIAACLIYFILHLRDCYGFQESQDIQEDLLTPYKSFHEHLNVNRNHRHVRDCQPIRYGNATVETFSKTNKHPETDPIKYKMFSKDVGNRFIYGHIATVSDPFVSLSVLEPMKTGGCGQNLRATVAESSKQMNCRIAVNAGYFNTHSGSCLGNIVSNGRLVRDAQGVQNANFGILKNGSIITGYLPESDVTPGGNETDFYQLVTGVFWILRNGSLYINESMQAECRDTEETGTLYKFANVVSARTAVGHDKNGNVIIVHVDGKTEQRGMNLYDFASVLKSYGLVNAINLDGGGSATFVVNHTVVNYPSDKCDRYLCERQVSTILCVHDHNSCQPSDCNGHGQCGVNGQCICNTPWTGPSCAQKLKYNQSESYCNVTKQSNTLDATSNTILADEQLTCNGNLSNCHQNSTTKTLIKRFLMKNYAWMDALLGISLIVNLILLYVIFCGGSSNKTKKQKSGFIYQDDRELLLAANNYDDEI